jgi:quinol monooxygenase YgiN
VFWRSGYADSLPVDTCKSRGLREHLEEHTVAELHVVAVIKAKEGKADVVREAMGSLMGPSRQDKGCIRYDLYEAQGAPGTFVNLEVWASQEDINAHLAQPHLGAAFANAGDALDGAPQIYMLNPVDVA